VFSPTRDLSASELDALVEKFDHHGTAYRTHSVDILHHMQSKSPFAHSPEHGGFWVATKADDCLAIAKDTGTFSSSPTNVIPDLEPSLFIPMNIDPPEFYEYRGILNSLFSPNRVKAHAEEKQITLCTEVMNKYDRPDQCCDHVAWAVDVLRRVNSPRVKLLFDIYHVQIQDGDISRHLRDNIQWIAHVHTAGVPGRYESRCHISCCPSSPSPSFCW